MPAMLPPRFMQPPRKPAFSRPASAEGITQYIPHQRRKNSVVDSSTTTVTGSRDIGHEKDRDRRHDGRDAEQRAEHQVRRPAAGAPAIANPAADQFADEAREEDDEGRAAEHLDVEIMHLEQIGRHPGQQTIEGRVEEHPAEAHAPDGAEAEIGGPARARRRRARCIFQRVGLFDIARLGFIDRRVFAR